MSNDLFHRTCSSITPSLLFQKNVMVHQVLWAATYKCCPPLPLSTLEVTHRAISTFSIGLIVLVQGM